MLRRAPLLLPRCDDGRLGCGLLITKTPTLSLPLQGEGTLLVASFRALEGGKLATAPASVQCCEQTRNASPVAGRAPSR